MKCPYCSMLMEPGYLVAGTTSTKGMTRLEWYSQRPRPATPGGTPLTAFETNAAAAAHRCQSCRAVVATY